MTVDLMQLKTCTKCGAVKPATTEFFYAQARAKNGLKTSCKKCDNDYHNTYKRNRLASDPVFAAQQLEWNRRSEWGAGTYDALVAHQGDQCAICGAAAVGRLDIDHCHDTLAIRGLLCNKHNMALGQFGDNPDLLIAAAMYLLNPPCLELGHKKKVSR